MQLCEASVHSEMFSTKNEGYFSFTLGAWKQPDLISSNSQVMLSQTPKGSTSRREGGRERGRWEGGGRREEGGREEGEEREGIQTRRDFLLSDL